MRATVNAEGGRSLFEEAPGPGVSLVVSRMFNSGYVCRQKVGEVFGWRAALVEGTNLLLSLSRSER
jgi:hypothetical protein